MQHMFPPRTLLTGYIRSKQQTLELKFTITFMSAPSHADCLVVRLAALCRISLSLVLRCTRQQISSFPYEDVLPFLKEHVQPSDQMLVLGCGTELPLQLSRDGYGTRRDACLLSCQHAELPARGVALRLLIVSRCTGSQARLLVTSDHIITKPHHLARRPFDSETAALEILRCL